MVRFSKSTILKSHASSTPDSSVIQIHERGSKFYPFLRKAYFRSMAAQLEPIQQDTSGRRYWDLLSDSALYIHAMGLISLNKISNKQGIRDLDSGLHAVLHRKDFFKYCFLEDSNSTFTAWKKMDIVNFWPLFRL